MDSVPQIIWSFTGPPIPEGVNDLLKHTVTGPVRGIIIMNPETMVMTEATGCFEFTWTMTSARVL